MHVLIEALGLEPGDEVITPAMTWVSTVNLIVLAGATPVFVDVDRDHLMTSAERVAERITDRTRLIVPVHFAGAALDLDPLYRLAAERGIAMVEDAAHAVATRYRGELVGRRGTCVFSFHAIKNLTTAEGGLVTTGDPELAERVRRLKFHGLGVDAFDRETQGRSAQAEVLEPGYKYNLPDLLAAIGLVQLERLDELTAARTAIATRYDSAFEGSSLLERPSRRADDQHSWHLYVVRLDLDRLTIGRAEIIQRLGDAGIGSSVHFIPLHLHPHYQQRYGYAAGDFPVAESIYERSISLPIWPGMTDAQVDRVAATLLEICEAARRPVEV
jgi:UDP-4-amino-4-deoxy-L-arabinose-oxoglutarate aminotransferase